MIATMSFEFPNGTVFCVGEEKAVARMRQYFLLQDQEYKNHIEMGRFVDRIILNHVYAYLEPMGIKETILEKILGYNRILQEKGLLLTEDEYIEAMVLAYPEILCKELELTNEEYEFIKRESIWNTRVGME